MKSKIKYSAKVEKLEGSRVKATVTIGQKDFETLRTKAENKVISEVKMDGFRDGKVPMSIFIAKYGEYPIVQEMGYMAVDETYASVIIDEKIEAIGRPEIAIEKPGMDKDGKKEGFEYTITVDVLPKIDLGDYKKYHSKVKVEEVKPATDEEVNDAVEELRRMRITKVKNVEGVEEDVMPEIDEEFLKSAGDFKTIDDLKSRIKDNMEGEKKWRAEEKRKSQILDLLAEETKVEVPETMIENELIKMESRIKADLSQMGVSFEDYLKHMKKDLSAWKESEKTSAKKQVVIQLALHAIGKAENIKVSDETVNQEVAHLMMQYKDVEKERAQAYTEERMTNSLIAEYLFTGKVPDEKELFGSHEGHNH